MLQRLVGRGDDADIDFDGLVPAHPFKRARLQHAQNPGLGRQRHVADFVQKNRALVALLKLPDALGGGARERPLFVPEQLAFQQIFRDRRAVDRQERQLAAAAVMVNRSGDQFFSRAAFTGDQGGRVGGGQLADQLENILHRVAAAHDAQVVVLRFKQRLIRDDLLHIARGFERGDNQLL